MDVYFDSSESEGGGIVLSRQRAENLKIWEDLEKAFNEGHGVEGQIVGKVKGGFKVDVGVPGFLPGSHVDIRPNRNLDRFVGTNDRFAILKFNRARGNVVVSRRALLEKERDSLKKEILKVLEEGVILEGTVKNITGYGAFVDLGGIDGISAHQRYVLGPDQPSIGDRSSGREGQSCRAQIRCRERTHFARHETIDIPIPGIPWPRNIRWARGCRAR